MKVALISCVSQKENKSCKAKDMYTSALFKKSYKYAESNFDKIYILSALHGLLDINELIEPYNLTLNNMKKEEKIEWSTKVSVDINKRFVNDEIYFLAGKKYYEGIIENLKIPYKIIMENLSIGKRLEWLNKENERTTTLFEY